MKKIILFLGLTLSLPSLSNDAKDMYEELLSLGDITCSKGIYSYIFNFEESKVTKKSFHNGSLAELTSDVSSISCINENGGCTLDTFFNKNNVVTSSQFELHVHGKKIMLTKAREATLNVKANADSSQFISDKTGSKRLNSSGNVIASSDQHFGLTS